MATNVLLAGKIKHPDGEWLVGDSLPDGHPGRIAKDDPRRLLFKVWTAGGDSPKYVRTPQYRGWAPPLPAHDGRLEIVHVFTGQFACETRRTVMSTILDPGDSIELGPDEYRRWFLPGGSRSASGITICRQQVGAVREFGWGIGCEYYSFIRPLVFPEWCAHYTPVSFCPRFMLVVVFEGIILNSFSGEYWGPLWYMFLQQGNIIDAMKRWVIADPRTSFSILYF